MKAWCVHLRRKLTHAARTLQVELIGRYSTQRVSNFAAYEHHTSLPKAIRIMVLTTLPCLVVPIFVDFARLADTSDGLRANWLFFVRLSIVWWVLSYLTAYQAAHFVSTIAPTYLELIVCSTVSAIATTAITYGLSLAVGFPLPFTIVVGAAFFVGIIFSTVALAWIRRIRATPTAKTQVVSLLKVWVCQALLLSIYPGYFYIFSTLPRSLQLPFACLLPVIKVLVRNWLSRALEDLRDEMSEHVILNADVFSALFIAYSMQNIPSIGAIAGLMTIDAAYIFITWRDVSRYLVEVEGLRSQIVSDENPSFKQLATGAPSDKLKNQSVLELANLITDRHLGISSSLVLKSTVWKRDALNGDSSGTLPPSSNKHICCRRQGSTKVLPDSTQKYVVQGNGRVHATDSTLNTAVLALPPLERQFIDKVGQIMFHSEFLLLLNYVEVVIPLVYCTYLRCCFHWYLF